MFYFEFRNNRRLDVIKVVLLEPNTFNLIYDNLYLLDKDTAHIAYLSYNE